MKKGSWRERNEKMRKKYRKEADGEIAKIEVRSY